MKYNMNCQNTEQTRCQCHRCIRDRFWNSQQAIKMHGLEAVKRKLKRNEAKKNNNHAERHLDMVSQE